MLVCINQDCQAQNPDGSNFCGKCGTHQPVKAGSLPEATQFCRACGTRRESYPNDRRPCTVLFADVHGYTAMSETLNDVEKVTFIMNNVFTRLTEKIVTMGGSIDKYAGDNIMARFGAPETHEDDPERAVRAALAMQDELRKISQELQNQYGFGLDMRIGLNTGEVNAAEVGGEVRGISYKTYTVMGDTVNLASRLEHEARIGHVLVGDLTYKLSNHAFEFIDMGYKQIRGKKEPVHCYEVVGPKERKNRRGLPGRDVPLIGRDIELSALWERLEKALEGTGQVVSVLGEAGVGKSSLLREFKRRINAYNPDIWYLDGASYSYSSTQYFSLMRTVLFKYCKISDNEEESEIRKKLLTAIRELMGEQNEPDATQFSEAAALLGQIAGISMPNAFIDGLDPQKRNNLLIDTIADFLLNKAQSNPLVLVLDDLHWVDSNSLKVIDRIVTRVTSSGRAEGQRPLDVLLLLLHRPDFNRIWPVSAQAPDSYEYIRLERFLQPQMEPLVRQFLEEWIKVQEPERHRHPAHEYGPIPTRIMQIVERAGGNPFFAEEILKRLLEDNHLVPDEMEESGWRVAGNLADFKPPETLQEILLTRVDNLDIYDKRVLQIAAVIGNRFEQRILLGVNELNISPEKVVSSISNLQRKDLIAIERSEPETEYTFRHFMTRDIAYNNLLGMERSQYHGQIGQAIERYKSDRLRDYIVVDDLAYHYERSNNEEKAVQYLMLAGNMRKSLFLNDSSLDAFQMAQEILQGPDFRELSDTLARLVMIDNEIGDILTLKSEYGEAITHYQAALKLCADPVMQIELEAKLIEVLGKKGEYDNALQVYEQARRDIDLIPEASNKNDPKTQYLRAKLLYKVATIYQRLSRYDEAMTAYEVSLSLMDAAEVNNQEVLIDRGRAYNGLGQVYAEMGKIAESEEALQKAAQLHEQTSKLDSLARTYNDLAFNAFQTGDLVKAEKYLNASSDNARRAGDVETEAASQAGLGFIAKQQGFLAKALRYFKQMENSSDPANVANAQLNMGQAYLQLGQFEAALTALNSAVQRADALGVAAYVAEGYNTLGWLYVNLRNWPEAERWLNEGLARSQDLNLPNLAADAYMYRLELYLEQQIIERAEVEQEAATKLITGMDDPMRTGQLERLEGRLASLKGDFNSANKAFEKSLASLESSKAYLEMAYSKLYFARTLLGLGQLTGDQATYEQARDLLMSSAATFDAYDILPKKEEAEALLHQLRQPVEV